MYYTSVLYTFLTLLTYFQSLSFLNVLQYLEYSDNTITKIVIDGISQPNCNTDTLLSISKEHEVKIQYYISGKPYIILFCKSQPFQKFPIYEVKELEKKAFEKNSDSIILLELFDFNHDPLIFNDEIMNTLLDKVKEYAGPKGNFYEDKNFYISEDSKFLLKKNLFNELENIGSTQIKKISIMYSDASEFILQ